MGNVVLAGLYEPGGVVELWRVENEAVLRVDAGAELVGRRVVDADGDVGFDGCWAHECYIASGYVDGRHVEVRARGVESHEGSELAQPVIGEVAQPVGTQEKLPGAVPPNAPAAALPTGVPGAEVVPAGAPTTDSALTASEEAAPDPSLEESSGEPGEADGAESEPLVATSGAAVTEAVAASPSPSGADQVAPAADATPPGSGQQT